jgi:hypothetical protein
MSTEANVGEADGWFKAEDKQFVFTIVNSTGGVQNITGWTIIWTLAANQFGSPILTKTAALTVPLSGICTVTVASADTSGLTAQTYYYALRRTDAGSRAELAYGLAVLRPTYTT